MEQFAEYGHTIMALAMIVVFGLLFGTLSMLRKEDRKHKRTGRVSAVAAE